MLKPDPTFSVVIPLFDTERYIAATLDCVLAQTYADFEVIVVDDASRDSGPEIVRGYMSRDARIRMVTQENRGLAGARNSGIRHARGSYIALLDADDLWAPRKLELHKAHLDGSPEIGVSYAPSIFIDEFGADLGVAQMPKLDGIDATHIFCRNPIGNGSAAVLRRSMLDDVAFEAIIAGEHRICWFDETFRQSEDIELWTRIAATTNWRFAGIAEPLTLYRVNNGGLSANIKKQFESWERVRAKLTKLAPELAIHAGKRAEAYQYRYLARRAAMSGNGAASVGAVLAALRAHPRIVLEEPSRTLVTLAFASLCCVLRASAIAALKTHAFAAARLMRKVAKPAGVRPSAIARG